MNNLNYRISHRILLLIQRLRILFYQLLSPAKASGKVVRKQAVLTLGKGKVIFEGAPIIGYFPSPFYLSTYAHLEARGKNSKIKIGEGTHINNNFVAVAEHASINIGKRVLIGTSVEIYDSDFHGLKVEDRDFSLVEHTESVNLEDDVFIGSNVKILKGVTIGRGSVVANGSVVVSSIPENVIAGGIPAKAIKAIL